jgi:ABC-type multidrug transport system fused ATPase/permease subunit
VILRHKNSLKQSFYYQALQSFSNRDKKRIVLIALLQILLALMDLLAVIVIGLIGALAVTGITSSQKSETISNVLQAFKLDTLPFQVQVSALAILASILLIAKTLISFYFSRRTLIFLSSRSAELSTKLLRDIYSSGIDHIQRFTTQELVYNVTHGVNALTVGAIGTLITLIADVALLFILGLGLFAVDAVTTLTIFVIFTTIGFALHRYLRNKASTIGMKTSSLNIESNKQITDSLKLFRELTTRSKIDARISLFQETRHSLSRVNAESQFMPYIAKYAIEVAIVIGALGISALQFADKDSVQAVGLLALFLAASTRIAPAILRIQQGALQIRLSMSSAKRTIQLMSALPKNQSNLTKNSKTYASFIPEIVAQSVSYSHFDDSELFLSDVNLTIEAGSKVAIVGPSGGGKSTLIDLLLGFKKPNSGVTQLSGMNPFDAFINWPGLIAYVPQSTAIIDATIRENICVGFESNEISDLQVWEALRLSSLADFVATLSLGIDTPVGNTGIKLSGGQVQRLGIARALVTSPQLIVFDEAMSALDSLAEKDIQSAISLLGEGITVVFIAHRLASVKLADTVIYVDSGKIIASGDFESVKKLVPNFQKQIDLEFLS